MESKQIYTKITYNIEKRIGQYKDGKITANTLNENLLLNLSSLCRFLKNREKEKQKEPNADMNETILDVFVPFSRLSATLQKKIESMITIDESQEFEKDLNLDECEFGPVLEDNEINQNINPKTKEFTNLIDGAEEIDQSNPNHYLLDDNQSVCMSLMNHPIEGDGHDAFVQYNNNVKNIMNKNRGTFISTSSLLNESETRLSNFTVSERSERITMSDEKKQDIETAKTEFKNVLKTRAIEDTIKEMSIEYLRYMYEIYSKMKKSSDMPNLSKSELNEYKSLNFINQFKSFVLEIGISDKKFYEQCIREIIYNKNMFEFSEFLECFRKLLNLKFDQTFLKYKCKDI